MRITELQKGAIVMLSIFSDAATPSVKKDTEFGLVKITRTRKRIERRRRKLPRR